MCTNLTKNFIKKFFAFAIILSFIFPYMIGTVYAIGNTDTKQIIISGLEDGVSLSAYQIIDMNYNYDSNQPKDPIYLWNNDVLGFFTEYPNYNEYIDKTDSNKVTDKFKDTSEAEQAAFLQSMSAYIRKNNIAAKKTIEATDNQVGLDLTMGQYILLATGNKAEKVYKPMTVQVIPKYSEADNDWNLVTKVGTGEEGTNTGTMKSQTVSISKEVDDKSVAIGDKVTYTLEANQIPDYPKDATNTKFIIKDTLPTGLTLIKDSISVKDSENVDIDKNSYTIDTSVEGKFTITFKADYVKANPNEIVKVTYEANVNKDAYSKYTNEETAGLENKAELIVSSDPYGTDDYTTEDKVKIYTYSMNLDKVKSDGTTTIAGAQFELIENTENVYFIKLEDGIYRKATSNTEQGATKTLIVNKNGHLSITGIDVGAYILKETKAPDGFVLPKDDISIKLNDVNKKGSLDETTTMVTSSTIVKDSSNVDMNDFSFKVINKTADEVGFRLPSTGGIGTLLFTIVGLGMMVIAGALFFFNKRKNKK